jgi:3-oxoacyl-[acyl-carrier protein] reductase/(S)-1-phenylethanol dehydrogenase
VNNVGTYPVTKWDELTLDEFRRVMAVNLESAFLLCKACIPSMRAGNWGRIVNVTSRTFWLPVPDMAAYLASKGGVIGLTRALATELGAHNITVNVVAPGLTRTATMEASTADAVFAMTANMQVIKRTQEPEDLVGLVSFLASDDSAFMTGQTLMVDGGLIRL